MCNGYGWRGEVEDETHAECLISEKGQHGSTFHLLIMCLYLCYATPGLKSKHFKFYAVYFMDAYIFGLL